MTTPEFRALDYALRATYKALAQPPRCRSCGEELDRRQEGELCPACILDKFPAEEEATP